MRCLYREKKYQCGEYLEVDIFPVFEKQRGRSRKRKPTSEVQKRLNQHNAERKLIRLLNTNFTKRDIRFDLTYDKEHLPSSPEDAQRQMQNFIRRVKRYRQKHDLPELKYVAVTEVGEKSGRIHHHIVMSGGIDINTLAEIWGRGYTTAKPLQFDECGITGIEYKEIIARGALDECDMSDFIFNRNHGQNDATVYARTRNGSLTYTVTERGLDIAAHLDGEDERHRNLHRDVLKRRVDKMSFSFVVRECSYDRETHTRTITKIKKLYDVSAVDFPQYNETSIVAARDFFSAEHEKEFKELEQHRRRQMLIAQTYC